MIRSATDEILRYDGPVSVAVVREATEDTTINGLEVSKGHQMCGLLGAGNRDPDVFPEPDRLWIDRPAPKPHLTFGAGVHVCLGAAVARLEFDIVVHTLLLDRHPELALVPDEPIEYVADFPPLRGSPAPWQVWGADVESDRDAPEWLAWSRRLRHEPPTLEITDDLDALDCAVGFAAEHARRYIASGGAEDGWDGPRPVCILYTVGRRSGRLRRTPVVYHDVDGRRFVLGTKGGDPNHPMWYLNLQRDPRVRVRVDARVYSARARTVSGAEREELWSRIAVSQPMIEGYQRACDREIPVVELVPAEACL